MWQRHDGGSEENHSFADAPGDFATHTGGANKFTVLVIGPSSFVTYWFATSCIQLGRAIENDVVLPERSVSRAHCRIHLHGHDFVVEELGSTNGSFVNRRSFVGRMVLLASDELSIGPYSISVRLGWLNRSLMFGLPGSPTSSPKRPPACPIGEEYGAAVVVRADGMGGRAVALLGRHAVVSGRDPAAITDPSLAAWGADQLPNPTAASLRRLIEHVLLGSSDIDAFICDYFRLLFRQLPANADRVTKVTLLLNHAHTGLILLRLREHAPQLVEQAEYLLVYEPR